MSKKMKQVSKLFQKLRHNSYWYWRGVESIELMNLGFGDVWYRNLVNYIANFFHPKRLPNFNYLRQNIPKHLLYLVTVALFVFCALSARPYSPMTE